MESVWRLWWYFSGSRSMMELCAIQSFYRFTSSSIPARFVILLKFKFNSWRVIKGDMPRQSVSRLWERFRNSIDDSSSKSHYEFVAKNPIDYWRRIHPMTCFISSQLPPSKIIYLVIQTPFRFFVSGFCKGRFKSKFLKSRSSFLSISSSCLSFRSRNVSLD